MWCIVVVSTESGSREWRSCSTRWRFEKGRWRLIGMDKAAGDSIAAGPDSFFSEERSTNYLTGKWEEKTTFLVPKKYKKKNGKEKGKASASADDSEDMDTLVRRTTGKVKKTEKILEFDQLVFGCDD